MSVMSPNSFCFCKNLLLWFYFTMRFVSGFPLDIAISRWNICVYIRLEMNSTLKSRGRKKRRTFLKKMIFKKLREKNLFSRMRRKQRPFRCRKVESKVLHARKKRKGRKKKSKKAKKRRKTSEQRKVFVTTSAMRFRDDDNDEIDESIDELPYRVDDDDD